MSKDLLFEIGVEELPSTYVAPALDQMEREAAQGLAALRLPHGAIRSYGTPRRLTIAIEAVAERQSDLDEEAMGPATRVAFDAEGKPTRALIGFCAGKGVDPAAVRRVQTPKGEYVAVTVHHEGQPASSVLPAMLADVARRLTFPKRMRWLELDDAKAAGKANAGDFFARPVRWLLALLGDKELEVKAFRLTASHESFGHRFLAPSRVKVKRASDYAATLEKAHVIADHVRRRAMIEEQAAGQAARAGGRVVKDDELVDINTFMVEWPTVFTGGFDPHYLDLPREVIVTALREHQRFFAVERDDGDLLPSFLAVRNGDDRGIAQVIRGNEDVLIARLEDARFYWKTDLEKTPEQRVDDLSNVVWIEGLGSLREKAARLESLGEWLAARLAPDAAGAVRRAARLCKTDLLTEMIGSGKEYASLEGVMGGYYARQAGESDAVATAIAEHYRPRGPADALPASDAGAILSLADKLDHVAGSFVGGKVPSGSEDPYGVRRAGNGVVRILIEQQRPFDLRDASMESTRPLFAADPELPHGEIMKKLGEFWRGRVEAALDDRGVAYDARDAAMEARLRPAGATQARPGWIDPADALSRARTLSEFRADRRFEPLAILFKRVSNILTKNTETLPQTADRARLKEPVEKALSEALESARAATEPLWRERSYGAIIPALLELEAPIHAFFDGVLVNAEDRDLRLARLALLAEVRELFLRGWDLSRVVVEGERSA
ncbi:MAG TPA: glycine--tRNA ligase subunit beta [Candidatus Udaeobacter sp.]|nr:glycine--tRNA ligase subunit beta [Candidatus Udaeobacter sp.]